jgi:predicted lipoprotein with Yx(FWY)xxD motif
MKKLMIAVAAGALAVTLAACGGSSTANTSSTASGATSVLENASGMALYTPNGESATNVRCTGACAAIWKPLRPGAAKLAGAAVITRPDGSKQLAVAGKPLYTFVQDMAGTMNGNGATDAFSGKQFTWHVVSSAGKTAVAAPTPSGGGSGSSSGY